MEHTDHKITIYGINIGVKLINLMFGLPCNVTYPYNKNQQDALFTLNLFQYLTSRCFEQVYCSSSWCLC